VGHRRQGGEGYATAPLGEAGGGRLDTSVDWFKIAGKDAANAARRSCAGWIGLLSGRGFERRAAKGWLKLRAGAFIALGKKGWAFCGGTLARNQVLWGGSSRSEKPGT